MLRLTSLVSLLLLTLSQSLVSASPCLSFDVNFNLLAFGFGGKDLNVGTQDVWANGQSNFKSSAAGSSSNLHLPQRPMQQTSQPLVVRQYFFPFPPPPIKNT